MDLTKITDFFDYEPVFDENPQFLVDKIKKKAGMYLPSKDIPKIQHAYEFALAAHGGDKRLSGEPYIIHPLKATEFLMKITPGLPSIQACILHDVIEDTPITNEEIKKEFGEEVEQLCEGLKKVGTIKYRGQDRQLETLKKTFLAMGKDLRVIFIKLCDRIHNIQTLHYHPKEEKRRRIAMETLKIYVPITQRLGLSVFQGYLENGAFKVLQEKEFNKIIKYFEKKYGEGSGYIENGIEMLSKILEKDENIKYYEIKGRLKSPYRIYKTLQKYQTKDLSKILDILAFRIITNTIGNCYNVLGILHAEYTPIINRIKDYISIPKPNGYSSLHTTILGMFDLPVEIQIRTTDMDEVAEYGVAAHFAYKEDEKAVSISKQQSQWIKKMQDIVKAFQEEADKDKFKDALQIEILEKNIFIYTPKGEIEELPNGSTVLDFAFKIHTDIGLKFKSAFVNGVFVPIDFRLKNGDIVEIKTFKNKYTASKSWIDYLHTPSAKAKLNRYLKQLEKEKYIEDGKEILNTKLKEFNLPKIGTKDDKITKEYKGEDFFRLMLQISDKQISPTKMLKEIYGPEIDKKEKESAKTKKKKVPDTTKTVKAKDIIIDGDKELDYVLCPECKPKSSDEIIGRVGHNEIKIHTLSCKALDNISYQKLIEAHWRHKKPNKYNLKLKIQAVDKPGILLKILSIFSELNIDIISLNVGKSNDDHYSIINIELEFQNPSKIFFALNELKNRENFLKIIDKKIC